MRLNKQSLPAILVILINTFSFHAFKNIACVKGVSKGGEGKDSRKHEGAQGRKEGTGKNI